MRQIRLLLSLTLVVSFCCLAQSPSESPQTPNTTKAIWVKNMQAKLPPKLCENNNYFIECFDVTSEECVEFTSTLVQACLNNIVLALPDTLNTKEGEYWGQMVGRCTFDLYEKYLQHQKKALKKCQLPSQPTNPNAKESQ